MTGRVLANGTGRAATRGGGEVIELEYGITVYPARDEHGRWRAVWHEDGQRQQCEAATEQKLAARLEKVTERLQAGAPEMKRPGADLIAWYLDPDRLLVGERWSRKHAHTQRRLCERFAIPVIGSVICQDITAGHMRQIVNAALTPGEGNRVQGMISALVSAGLDGGYLASPRLAKVHWQAGDRPLAAGRHGERDELMASTAAYSGLRWGELTALTIAQIDTAARVITVDRKVVEVAGHLYIEAPSSALYRDRQLDRIRTGVYQWSAGQRAAARTIPAPRGPAGPYPQHASWVQNQARPQPASPDLSSQPSCSTSYSRTAFR